MKVSLALFIAVIAVLITQPARAQVVAGPITNSANGHTYYLVGPTFWTNAEAQAVSMGGHLVTINDAAENAWVFDAFANYGGVSRDLFIGFTDQGHEGQWTWLSGEPVTYAHWAPGEPNNGMGVFPYENLSMMYGAADGRAGFWNDIIGSIAEQQYWGVIEVTPLISIRVSEVELCWPTLSGVTYQLQYRSGLTANTWLNLGAPITANGLRTCVSDPLPAGEPQRFYRVLSVP